MKGGFLDNLGKVYGIYTGTFIGFVIFLAILEQLGVPNKIIGYLFVFMTIGIYALIGILSRTTQVSEYYVAGRSVPAVYNGMATGSDWMSGASFVGMAGTFYASGYDGLAYALGWTGGFVLVAVLMAPYLRKFGAYTVPDFLGTRYGGNFARAVGIIVLLSCSFTYVTAQIYATGIITSRFLGLSFEVAVFAGLVGILVCSMLGGMRAVTWTQVAQYIILIIAYLTPVVILSAKVTGVPIPQIMYGQVLQEIARLEQTSEFLATVREQNLFHTAPFTRMDPVNFFGLIFCLMLGTASLPHVLMRFFTTPSVREARVSVGWSLLFIFLLYFTAPAYAAFAKYEVYANLLGKPITDLPAWVAIWKNVGLVTITDIGKDGLLHFADLKLNNDAIVLATPEIAGLPYVIAGLVAAGGLAAALSTADGLLLAISNALSHDVYYRMINPHADTARRLMISRVLLVVVAILAAYTASTKPSDILSMVAWAFSIAASGLFCALVLGVWWKRCNTPGAVAGMIAGFGVCMYYLIGTRYGGMPEWFGVKNISAGVFGIPVAFITTVVVSLLTKAPSQEMQQLIDDIRVPRGETFIDREKNALAGGH
ncbi:sodium:solute symporter family protein [Novispirillum itersonii]|uniref:Cation/acetate symporter n=1 Tax=Novispirillum itersonii TaxID=189 RepID=A0A7W9ZJC0_NOVIT|nr:sodium:solute symporter family protein [Novispirillum itersonii]MBB6211209.1 cation/acetate symporter [Novispirillum itersonii]